MKSYTVDLGSIRLKNMLHNMNYNMNGSKHRKQYYNVRHISESPYDVLYKNKRNVKRANKTLTGIRYAVRWNKEKIKC